MDPNQCLKELLELLEKYKEQKDRLHRDDVQDLVIHIEGLDAWISRGGFLPTAWSRFRGETDAVRAAKSRVVTGLAEFSDENPTFPEKRNIEDFYEAVRLLHTEGRIV